MALRNSREVEAHSQLQCRFGLAMGPLGLGQLLKLGVESACREYQHIHSSLLEEIDKRCPLPGSICRTR